MLDALDGSELAIAEGIETAMAARQLGIRPTWALGSVGAISHFPVIDAVERLTVVSENDTASHGAIGRFCGPRWREAGRRVRVVIPQAGSSDLNDEVRAHP
jgi:hypothetical protein